MTIEKFETFLSQMEENWSEAYENMTPAMPRIDKIQSINDITRSKVMAEYGLLGADFGLLAALRRTPEPHLLKPTEIMDYMLISSGGLTKALYRLEKKELISRSASPEDGRIKLVKLTLNGKKVIEDVMDKVHSDHKTITEALSKDELVQLDILLSKLLSKMEG
ncbi:MarR family winged helix-turn-helix transcriptional regulator [Vibrio sp. HN007]|uniref:MarR family winged helix-turn-helix transcriptional regulator n=1 Tax=Vibrio iocasae TaxID=3098914 RepID=UPI0035D4FD6B